MLLNKKGSIRMKKYLSMIMSTMLILCLAGCRSDSGTNSDDEIVIFNPNDLLGSWWVTHHSLDPDAISTCDAWDFRFNADGTGFSSLCTHLFTYEIQGNHVILNYKPNGIFPGSLTYKYTIKSCSNDKMEWHDTGQSLNFMRPSYDQYLVLPVFLYNVWTLDSYGDANGIHPTKNWQLTIFPNNRFYISALNEITGNYQVNGQEIHFTNASGTKMDYAIAEDALLERNIYNIQRFDVVTRDTLYLYCNNDLYFVFKK